jgi:hypothetical protein
MRLSTPRSKTRLAATSTVGDGHAAITASATPWAPMFTAESLRRLTRSESTPMTMRPSSAATVVALTVRAARLSPRYGSSTLIWWTRKPTWAASAKANGMIRVQSSGTRSTSCRVRTLDWSAPSPASVDAESRTSSPATWAGVGRPPITSQTSGRPMASRATLTTVVANRKPPRCASATRIGTSTMPPTLAPVRRASSLDPGAGRTRVAACC